MKNIVQYMMLWIVLCTTACTHTPSRCVQLPSNTGQYCLQPSSVVAPFAVQQTVEINYRDVHEVMITDLDVSQSGLQMIAFTPFGQKLMQVNDNNVNIVAENPLGARLDPAMLVALLQLALWPSDAVKQGLSPSLTLMEAGAERTVLSGNQVILHMQYANKLVPYQQLSIDMPRMQFSLNISTLVDSTDAIAQ